MEEDTYILSERLGRGKEMTDREFDCYTEGDWNQLTPRRRLELTHLFVRDPWNGELVEAITRRRQAQASHDPVAHEQFMRRLQEEIASA